MAAKAAAAKPKAARAKAPKEKAPKAKAAPKESPLIPGMDFMHEIGTSAGIVWQYLDQNGPVTLFDMKKNIPLSGTQIDRAIGWLAREGKIEQDTAGSKTMLINQS